MRGDQFFHLGDLLVTVRRDLLLNRGVDFGFGKGIAHGGIGGECGQWSDAAAGTTPRQGGLFADSEPQFFRPLPSAARAPPPSLAGSC